MSLPLSSFEGHVHLMATTRAGKTYLLQHLFTQIAGLKNPSGDHEAALVFIDPNGDAYRWLKRWAYEHNLDAPSDPRLVLLDLAERDYVAGFNPFIVRRVEDMETYSFSLAETFLSVLRQSPDHAQHGEMIQEMLHRTIRVLLEAGLTLTDSLDFLNIGLAQYRRAVLGLLADPRHRALWRSVELYDDKLEKSVQALDQMEMRLAVRRRFQEFLIQPTMRRMYGSPASLSWADVLDRRRAVLVNVEKAAGLRDTDRQLFGLHLLTDLIEEAKARPQERRVPCYVFIDECYNFLSEQLVNALPEMAKYGVHFILAHQYLGQLKRGELDLASAVKEVTNTKIAMSVNDPDSADYLARTMFGPWFDLHRVKQTRWYQLSKIVWETIETLSEMQGGAEGSGSAETWHGGSTLSGAHMHPGGTEGFENVMSGWAQASGYGRAVNEMRIDSWATGRSVAKVPVNEPGDPLRFDDYYSLEEQRHMAAAAIMLQLRRQGVVYDKSGEPKLFTADWLDEPRIALESLPRLDRELRRREPTLYLPAAEIDRVREERSRQLLESAGPKATTDLRPEHRDATTADRGDG